MRTTSALHTCAALTLVLLLSQSAPRAVASRAELPTATPRATAQAHQTNVPQQQETTHLQRLATALAAWMQSASQINNKASEPREAPSHSQDTAQRFGRGPGLLIPTGAGASGAPEEGHATSAAAMASRAEKLRAWWRESAAAWGSCVSTLRRRFQGGRRRQRLQG